MLEFSCSIFETSCTNTLMHDEHERVICAKKSLIEKKVVNNFKAKNEIGVARIFKISDLYMEF